jgi:hypothetical protein
MMHLVRLNEADNHQKIAERRIKVSAGTCFDRDLGLHSSMNPVKSLFASTSN